jgi:hypothetical protein
MEPLPVAPEEPVKLDETQTEASEGEAKAEDKAYKCCGVF